MRSDLIRDLDDCTEFRQALRARTPRIVHGTAALLIVLLAAAFAWMALTKAFSSSVWLARAMARL